MSVSQLIECSEIEYQMHCNVLKKAGIPIKSDAYPTTQLGNVYPSGDLVVKKIFIPKSKINEARQLLGIDQSN